MYNRMTRTRSEIDVDVELSDIYREGEALESEYFILSINMNDFGAPYGLALEDSSQTGAGAQMKNLGVKIINFIKRIIEAIPKLFNKLFTKIKHSKLLTKARLQAGTPKDLKHISKDKVQVIKQRRMEILTTKQKLIEAADKKIEKALYLSEEIDRELTAVARYMNVSDKTKADIIKGKFDISLNKINKLNSTYDEIKGIKIDGLYQELNKYMESLKHACDNDRLFALCVPQYSGTDKSEQYRAKIDREMKSMNSIVGDLETLIRKDVSFGEAWHGFAAKQLGKIDDRTIPKTYERGPNGSIQEKEEETFRLSSYSERKHAEARASRNAATLTSGINQILNLYKNSSTYLAKVAQQYCQVCAAVYKVFPIPEGEGDRTEEFEEPENKSGKKLSHFVGTIVWSDKRGCWVYQRQCIDINGNNRVLEAPMVDEKDKEQKPKPSKELVKRGSEEIKKLKDFKKFVEDNESKVNE